MAQNFVGADRDQVFLLPPSLRDWLPEDHLAWWVIDAVAEMDLAAFYARYRADGHGRAAYDPAVVVAILLYAYAIGERSARRIERRCVEDIAFRVLAGNLTPDHVTICRFRQEHQDALAGLFGQVLGLCAKAGMVSVGTIAVDGTRMAANASRDATVDYEQLARTILEEAAQVDAAEDEQFGDRRGDELPEQLTTRYGRRAWLREAVRDLEAERAAEGKPIERDRGPRLREAKRRMDEELWVAQRANEAYEAWRARGISADGTHRMAPGTLKPFVMPTRPEGQINLTDPDSRVVPTRRGFMQGYTAQAVTTESQIVVCAEVICGGNERGTLQGLVADTEHELDQAGVGDPITVTLADAGFWNTEHIQTLSARGIRMLVSPDNRRRTTPGKTRVNQQHYIQMREQLSTDDGRALYKTRKSMIEPVFGQIKHNRRIDRFTRRGLAACRAEWRLVMATHNLLKLHTRQAHTA
jgi:transposase